jgi:hypothetical protein
MSEKGKHRRSLDAPDSENVTYRWEEEGEEMQLLSACPAQKDTFMALSVSDTVISASEADDKIVKVIDDIQDFVSTIYMQPLKQRSIESYFKF